MDEVEDAVGPVEGAASAIEQDDVYEGTSAEEARGGYATGRPGTFPGTPAEAALERTAGPVWALCRRASAELGRFARERPLALGLGAIAFGMIARRLLPRR